MMIKTSPVIASTTTCTVCSASGTRTSVCVNLTGKPAHTWHSIDKDSWDSGLGSNICKMHCHNRTLALTFLTQFAMVKHNQEQAYGTPNGSGGTVTDALSGKIQSESCSHTDIRCRAHPLPPMLNRHICCHCLYLSGGVMQARRRGSHGCVHMYIKGQTMDSQIVIVLSTRQHCLPQIMYYCMQEPII